MPDQQPTDGRFLADWKTEAITQAIKQGPSFVFAASLLCWLGYTLNWIVVPSIRDNVASVQSGNEKIADKYEKNITAINTSHAAIIDKITTRQTEQIDRITNSYEKQVVNLSSVIQLLDRQVTRLEKESSVTPN